MFRPCVGGTKGSAARIPAPGQRQASRGNEGSRALHERHTLSAAQCAQVKKLRAAKGAEAAIALARKIRR
jgi:hypothetical protein